MVSASKMESAWDAEKKALQQEVKFWKEEHQRTAGGCYTSAAGAADRVAAKVGAR